MIYAKEENKMRKRTVWKKVSVCAAAAMLFAGVAPAGALPGAGMPAAVQAAEWVETVESGDYMYNLMDDGTAEIVEYMGTADKLVIPATLDGHRVTTITSSALYDNSTVTNVEIEEGITTIEDSAFMNFTKLEHVKIPASVTEIAKYTFYGCTGLTTVDLSEGITKIEHDAFSGCIKLEAIQIPASAIEIGDSAFEGCISLKNVSFSQGLQTIGDFAFEKCTGLQSITIPASVTSIGFAAFSECTSLSSVALPGNLGTIGEQVFSSCISLTAIQIPASVRTIESAAFSDTGLTGIVIPSGVQTIGEYAFSTETLKMAQVPDSVTTLASTVFGSDVMIYCNPGSAAALFAVANGNQTGAFADYGKAPAQNPQGGQKPAPTPAPSKPAPSNPAPAPTDPFAKGMKTTASGGTYVSLGNGKASYVAPVNKKKTSATVLDTVKVSGKSYKVTQINAKAFSGCKKLKKITIKAKSLTKVGSKAFKGIHKKAKIKVPKAKLAAYKKLLKGKGQAKSVKITK